MAGAEMLAIADHHESHGDQEESDEKGGHGLEALGDPGHEDLEDHDDPAGVRDGLSQDAPCSVLVHLREEIGDSGTENTAHALIEPGRIEVAVDVDGAQIEEAPEGKPEKDPEKDQQEGEPQIGKGDSDFLEFLPEGFSFGFPLRLLVEEDRNEEHHDDGGRRRQEGIVPGDGSQLSQHDGPEGTTHVDHGVKDAEAQCLVGLVGYGPDRAGDQGFEDTGGQADGEHRQYDAGERLGQDQK